MRAEKKYGKGNYRFVVGVHSDKTVKRYKRRPAQKMEDRIENVATFGKYSDLIQEVPKQCHLCFHFSVDASTRRQNFQNKAFILDYG